MVSHLLLTSSDAVLENHGDDHGEDAGEEDDGNQDVGVDVLLGHKKVADEPHGH